MKCFRPLLVYLNDRESVVLVGLPIGGWYMGDPRTVRLLYELPEVASLALKLSGRMPLSEGDEHVLLGLA